MGQVISARQLDLIMPRCPDDKIEAYAEELSKAIVEAHMTTVTRAAAFLGQLALESGELRWWEELADGKAYEGRADLGNVSPGDGPRFKGRGPIQLTGRKNYTDASEAILVDIVSEPELVLLPEVGFRTAAWYWTSRDINELADLLDYRKVTVAVNGGYTHHDRREKYYNRALEVLGVFAPLPGLPF